MDCSGEHDALRRMMDEFADLMACSGDESRAALPRARMLFSQLFTSHLAKEHAYIRALVASPAGLRFRPVVEDYEARIAGLRMDYSAHIRTWTPARVAACRPDYVLAVLALQDRLRALMDWEERYLFPRH